MATNTSDIVYPSDSDDCDYQYEVQNLVQQVIHFIDNNNVPSSYNESFNNDSPDNESVDSENGQMVIMEIACRYQFQTMSEIQNMKHILKWYGNRYFIQTLGQVLGLSWEKKCCSWIKKRMNNMTSLKLCLRLKCGTILPMKLPNMLRQGLHKDISKNKYLLFYIPSFFHHVAWYLSYFQYVPFFNRSLRYWQFELTCYWDIVDIPTHNEQLLLHQFSQSHQQLLVSHLIYDSWKPLELQHGPQYIFRFPPWNSPPHHLYNPSTL